MTFNEEDLRIAARQVEMDWEQEIDSRYGSLQEHKFSRRFERRMRRIILDISRNPKQKRFASISKRVAVVFFAVLF
ncbi:MAG: hypothetical protein J5728_10880 [Lachnospiraceae bacterium]|nr:hypothetical protein [Lachnospiraceae bacterium]